MALTRAQFDRLVDDHGPALYRTAYRLTGDAHEAEDMVQEAFRSAWNSRARYEEGRGDRAWLISILRRRIIDRWRKKPPPVAMDPTIQEQQQSVDAEDPFADNYTDEMQRALNRLPPELRESLLLVVVGELTHQEVSQELSVPLGTVLSRVSRARKRLREYLTEELKSPR